MDRAIEGGRDKAAEQGMRLVGAALEFGVELPEHPWFTACQFHPEFKSRPDRPHPLFLGFVEAAASRS